jgi:hypothetical protein
MSVNGEAAAVNGTTPELVNGIIQGPVNGSSPALVNGIVPEDSINGIIPEPANGTPSDITPTAEEPAVLRPPRPSPSQRFAWRTPARNNHTRASGVNVQDRPTPCPFLDCAKDAETDGSGGDKKMPITNSMMKAYVAMRAGVNSVVASTAEPLLGRLVGQEMDRGLGAPQ